MRRRGERVLGPYRHLRGWQLVLVAADGTRVVESFTSKERAEARKQELELDRVSAATTIDQAIDAYERYMTHVKKNKPKSYRETVRRLRRFFKGELDLTVDMITVQRLKKLYGNMSGAVRRDDVHAGARAGGPTGHNLRDGHQAGAGPAAAPYADDTHRNYLAEAKTFVRWCAAQRWVRELPLDTIEGVGKRKKGKKQPRIDEARLWRAEAHRRALKGEHAAVAALMTMLMGLRVSEVVTRKVRDLDNDGQVLWIEDAKTESGNRPVNVPEELRGYLKLITAGQDREGWLFAARRGKKGRHDRKWPLNEVKDICKAVKVPEVTAHGMRGFASTLAGAAAILSGSGLDAVAASLGHVDTKMVETVYADKGEMEKAKRRRALTVLDGGK